MSRYCPIIASFCAAKVANIKFRFISQPCSCFKILLRYEKNYIAIANGVLFHV